MHTDFSKKEVTVLKSYHFAHSLSISMRVFTHALNMFTLSSSKFEIDTRGWAKTMISRRGVALFLVHPI